MWGVLSLPVYVGKGSIVTLLVSRLVYFYESRILWFCWERAWSWVMRFHGLGAMCRRVLCESGLSERVWSRMGHSWTPQRGSQIVHLYIQLVHPATQILKLSAAVVIQCRLLLLPLLLASWKVAAMSVRREHDLNGHRVHFIKVG